VVIGYSLMLLLFGLGCRWPANLLQATWWKCRKIVLSAWQSLNCWYGTTEYWQISWCVSFHTSTSVAATNASTVVCFFKDMQLFNVTLHQNSKLDSLRLGLTFQIENLLSCRRVWKLDLWNIYIIKISQDLCSTVTVNKCIIVHQKSDYCFGKIFIFGNGQLNTLLY